MSSEVAWNPGLWTSGGGRVQPNWDLIPFCDLLQSPKSINVGVMYPGAHIDGGVPLIRVGDIGGGGAVHAPTMSISQTVHYEYRRTELSGDELLITLVGTPGVCVLVRNEMKGWNVARALAVARLKRPDFRPYIKAVMESSVMRNIITSMLNTTVQPTLNLKEIKALPVPMPRDPAVAVGIGDVAVLFSDRIALLHQVNATLEAIAQALFKSWFVDFDPVHAMAEGRAPTGMDAATAAQFPSEFEDSELGPIPKGWRVCTVADIAAVIRGRSYKSSELAESNVALVTLKSFERGGGFRRDGFKSYTGAFKPEQVLDEGDCVVACTDVTQRAELIGRAALVTASPAHSELVASLDVAVVRPTQPSVSSVFLASLLAGSRYVSHVLGHATGTTVLHLSRDAVPNYAFACPPSSLRDAYTSLAGALFEQHANNVRREETLADVRDTLLPRLISGKLRVPAVEDLAAEA